MRLLKLILLSVIATLSFGQELNCNVIIESDQIQTQERQIFTDMEVAFTEFLNNTSWTEDEFDINEKIKCNLVIRLTSGNVNSGTYSATAQLQGARPVYGTDYETVTFHFVDQYFDFSYRPGMDLNFNVNSYTNNLTSMLGFYANIMIGYDYDSFSELGGTKYFEIARNISNTVPTGVSDGWSERKGPNNRFFVADQTNNPQSQDLRKAYYRYHRHGFDVLAKKPKEAHKEILEFLEAAKAMKTIVPLSVYRETLFLAKRDELIKLFKPLDEETRKKAVALLRAVDPTNISKYQTILE
jgi:hypothetical protein